MMSIQRNMKTPTSLLQVIPLYISKLLSKCTSIHSSLHPCLPLLWIISDCLLMMSIRRHTQTKATTYKSFHYTEVACCLNLHPFILLCTLVFPYYESSLIVFSWWVFGDTLRQRLLLISHSTIQKCSVVSIYIRSFFSAPLSSLIMNHLWFLLMMSIRRQTHTTATTYQSFHCTELCFCLNVHPFILLCTLVFPYFKSSLIVFSWWVFRDTGRPQPPNYKSFHCT